jgi:heterodisulfide reductase subunit A2
MKNIGLYICKCGGTISDRINVDKVTEEAKKIEGISSVQVQDFYCTEEGKNFILKDIKKSGVDTVVMVACSPKLHSKTFTDVLLAASLNPYLLQMVNIREQCIWMTKDNGDATEKVIRMMKAGVEKARYLEALEQKEIDVNTDVLVIGGGISGIEASLLFAKQGRTVYLVEKEPGFGGVLPKLEHVYPTMECAPCFLAPRIKEVADNDSIKLFYNSTVEKVTGFGGNFTVTIKKSPTYVKPEACISCMACIAECPVSAPNAFNSGMNKKKAIDFYFPGSVPKAPYIDPKYCLRFNGQTCSKCKEQCSFDAIDYDAKDELVEINVGGVVIATGA